MLKGREACPGDCFHFFFGLLVKAPETQVFAVLQQKKVKCKNSWSSRIECRGETNLIQHGESDEDDG